MGDTPLPTSTTGASWGRSPQLQQTTSPPLEQHRTQWLVSRHQCGNCQHPQANQPHPNEQFHKIKPPPSNGEKTSNGEKKILFKNKLTYKGNKGLKNCSQPTSSAKFFTFFLAVKHTFVCGDQKLQCEKNVPMFNRIFL